MKRILIVEDIQRAGFNAPRNRNHRRRSALALFLFVMIVLIIPLSSEEVQDTGVDIAPDEMERIFDPFVQRRSSKTPSEGSGLGLVISRKFIQMMGGDIAVESPPPSIPLASFDFAQDERGGGSKGGAWFCLFV
jgi:signal transduction histidine kinase